jgi:hypothetical protein
LLNLSEQEIINLRNSVLTTVEEVELSIENTNTYEVNGSYAVKEELT